MIIAIGIAFVVGVVMGSSGGFLFIYWKINRG